MGEASDSVLKCMTADQIQNANLLALLQVASRTLVERTSATRNHRGSEAFEALSESQR